MLSFISIPVTPFMENCTLLYDQKTKKALICDPGGDHSIIIDEITKHKLIPEKILITHAHLDHIGAVKPLAEKYQIPIYGPTIGDQFLLEAIPQQSQMLGLPLAPEFKVDQYAQDRDLIKFSDQEILVLHCPGHTPGHVVYYAKDSKLCLTGDVIFYRSIGRTDFPRGNYEDLINSIRQNILTLPDDTIIIPGHGPYSLISEEKKHNPYIVDALD